MNEKSASLYSADRVLDNGLAALKELLKINPFQNDTPKHRGNCNWCAIEATRVILLGVEANEIPGVSSNYYEHDPIEALVYPKHGCVLLDKDTVGRLSRDNLLRGLKTTLEKNEVMLVSLDGDESSFHENGITHSYLIYRNKEGVLYLIDADRQVFVPLKRGDDFIQTVKGLDSIFSIDYSNGAINPDDGSYEHIDLTAVILNEKAINAYPLPIYIDEQLGPSIAHSKFQAQLDFAIAARGRVKHGLYAGKPPADLHATQLEFDTIKAASMTDMTVSIADYQRFVEFCVKMNGKKHPLTVAARKLNKAVLHSKSSPLSLDSVFELAEQGFKPAIGAIKTYAENQDEDKFSKELSI